MPTEQETATAASLHNLKRKRTRERANATRFITAINSLTENTALEDFTFHRDRLQETLTSLTQLDDGIHDLLSDAEYNADITVCDEYIDNAKRAIQKATIGADKKLYSVTSTLTINEAPTTPTMPTSQPIKLPTIKLSPFTGDIEEWSRFWEQFTTSIDQNPTVSQVDKHVFLRGYLEGEPKHLVDGIAITAGTYNNTKKILISKYGDENRIIQAHLDYLENIPPIHSATPESLNHTYVECNRRIQALQALGENISNYGRVLAPKILRAFPDDICRRWIIHTRRDNVSEGDIIKLMCFLNEEVEGALISQKIRGESYQHPASIYQHPASVPATAAFQIYAHAKKGKKREKERPQPFCIFCEGRGHWAQDCTKVTGTDARTQKLKQSSRCFLCLKRGHHTKDCSRKGRASCSQCGKGHHRAICSNLNHSPVANCTETTAVGKINVTTPGFTHLQTARIWISGPTGSSKLTRCVLDGGSQSSFVKSSLVDELGLEVIGDASLKVHTFETPSNTSHSRRFVRLKTRGFWDSSQVTLTAFETTHSFSHHPAVPRDITMTGQTRKLQLADPTDDSADLPIELLIGGDQYWTIVSDSAPIRLSSSVVLIPSKFGWIFTGNRSGVSATNTVVNFIDACHSMPCDDSLRRFWDLESVGIAAEQDRAMSAKDTSLLTQFHASYSIEDQRRVVRLPRKETMELANNYHVAEKRFQSLETRFRKNEALKQTYTNHMMDYIRKGHVELAPKETRTDEFYLPHHLVKKEKHGTIKWRIVFDASSHEENARPLNETLEMGPNLLPELFAVLLRFRSFPYGVIGDISQAFLQLSLHEEDRDLTRFLWYRVVEDESGAQVASNEQAIFRFTRLPFGLTCSPFLLSATLRELATRNRSQFPSAASFIDENTFMDDIIAGARGENEAIALYYELTSLMKKISLPMSKWATSSQQLIQIWKAEGREITTETHVLGVPWNTVTDSLTIDVTEITTRLKDRPATKRHLLQATASFYDPLGLMTPVSILGKILFQDTWHRGLTWDELLPQDLASRWHSWTSSLPQLSQITVPRWAGMPERDITDVHVFCDASERAYGAVLYIRSLCNGTTSAHMLCSKSRLAPVKKVTLPRLELLAAVIGVRLLNYCAKALTFDTSRGTLWTDSRVTLGWIQNDPSRWKTFVCNRVTEIQSSTTPSQWRHCPGKDNPADHLSRGLTAEKIKTLQAWWKGPSWLSLDQCHWPHSSPVSTPLPEARTRAQDVLQIESPDPVIEATRYSSYIKLLRVTAWVLRFVRLLRNEDQPTGELTAEDINGALRYWIKAVQMECFPAEIAALERKTPLPEKSKIKRFNPFLDNGILRLGGRLQYAAVSESERHPIIMEGRHHFTQLLIRDKHIRLHHLGVQIVLSDLRSTYWILGARRAIKHVLHQCLPCKMVKNVGGQAIEAPLPSQRVTPSKPFAVTGIDFAGPLYVRAGTSAKKCYITLFTCATTRALHLELSGDMSADRFMQALQRFVGRRGLPHTIYSDNAQTFHAANKELSGIWASLSAAKTHRYLSEHGVTWKFIAPRAAWWGGWWERMVGSTKRCLRKVLGRSSIDEEGLQTVLVSIEAALNSRPLTRNGDTGDVLTPAHFLVGEKLTTVPSGPEPPTGVPVREFRLRQQLADDFWKRWSKEYLLLLQSFHQVQQPKKNSTLRVGDVALLQSDLQPRHLWRKVRIHELRTGRDGIVRTVILSTADGKQLARPVQLVVPLEVDQGGEDVGN